MWCCPGYKEIWVRCHQIKFLQTFQHPCSSSAQSSTTVNATVNQLSQCHYSSHISRVKGFSAPLCAWPNPKNRKLQKGWPCVCRCYTEEKAVFAFTVTALLMDLVYTVLDLLNGWWWYTDLSNKLMLLNSKIWHLAASKNLHVTVAEDKDGKKQFFQGRKQSIFLTKIIFYCIIPWFLFSTFNGPIVASDSSW